MAKMTTSQLRAAWGPACTGTKVSLAEAYRHLDICFQRWSYRIRPGVTGAMNCRRITGGPGYSLHAFGPGGIFVFWTGVRVTMALAVDVNWDRNPYGPRLITDMPLGMINDITNLRTNNGQQVWGWGGHYGKNKDAMHFEVVCSPASMATGIRGGGGLPAPAPEEPPPAAEIPLGAPTMFIVIHGVACIGLFNNVMFQYATWETFLKSKAASPGTPMVVVPDTESSESRLHLHNQLFKQHVAAVG